MSHCTKTLLTSIFSVYFNIGHEVLLKFGVKVMTSISALKMGRFIATVRFTRHGQELCRKTAGLDSEKEISGGTGAKNGILYDKGNGY